MSNRRYGAVWKVLAVLLFLTAVTAAWYSSMCAAMMVSAGYGRDGTYRSGAACREQIQEYQRAVADLMEYQQKLEQDEMSYLDRVWMQEQVDRLQIQLHPDNTNFRYELRSYDGARLEQGNLPEGEHVETATVIQWYAAITLRNGELSLQQLDVGTQYGSSFDHILPSQLQAIQQAAGVPFAGEASLILVCGLPGEWTVQDEFAQGESAFRQGEQALPFVIAAAAGCVLTALICLIYLCLAAGHRRGMDGIHLNRQDRIWYDVYLVGMAGLSLVLIWVLDEGLIWIGSVPGWMQLLQAALLGVLPGAALLLALLLTTVTRCKAGVLWSNTLLASLWRLVRWFVSMLPVTWRLVFVFVCYELGKVVLKGWFGTAGAVFELVLDVGCLLYLCWWAVNFRRLRRAGEALAAGDLEYRADTQHMPGDLRRHGEDLNNISGGMANAIQEQMKSERFRAELITNVSHDLKTPLTSIINYVDLLKKTDIQDEKAWEYVQVLDNKSQRLKKLTEDLVEASKASAGTLSVNREKLGIVQLINQALGEYEEKLADRRLQVVTDLPESEVYVLADGRHLWRVLDNLLSNCVKYAMGGTRVYLELQRGRGQIVLSVKNISAQALNVPAEQLMERFVRGDKSRTTEGSGLGLSIAHSLTELQGGVFEISVDGDLFKATVSLPQMV